MNIFNTCICTRRIHVKTTYLDKQSIVFIQIFVFNKFDLCFIFLVDWAMSNAENIHARCTCKAKVYLFEKCVTFQTFHPPNFYAKKLEILKFKTH